jgi:hypothetical protein
MYTVTITAGNYSETYTNQTAKQVKALKADFSDATITVMKGAPAAKKTYYRGNEVTIIEERQNGYTLVFDGQNDIFANTSELEYK